MFEHGRGAARLICAMRNRCTVGATAERELALHEHSLRLELSALRVVTAQSHGWLRRASRGVEAYAKICELERALSRKTMEVEILRTAQEIVKKTPSLRRESAR